MMEFFSFSEIFALFFPKPLYRIGSCRLFVTPLTGAFSVSSSNLNPVQPLALSIPDTCIALGSSRQTIYELIKSGRLRSYTEGKRRFVSRAAIDDYIAQREAEAAQGYEPAYLAPGLEKYRQAQQEAA